MKLQFRNLHYATRLYPKEAACPIKQDFSPGAAVIVYVFFFFSFFFPGSNMSAATDRQVLISAIHY